MKRFNNIWWVGGFLVYVVDQGGGGLRCGWVQLVWAAKQHNTEKPQPTFAAAVDILPYYAKTPMPLSLSLSQFLKLPKDIFKTLLLVKPHLSCPQISFI